MTKLSKIKKIAEKLSVFLKKREWECDDILQILEDAETEIKKIESKAIDSLLYKLEHSYKAEADIWTANNMTDANGKKINISVKERNSAGVDSRKIEKAIVTIKDLE